MRSAKYCGNKEIKIIETEPEVLGPEDVRIKVAYCGICGTDLHIYKGHMDKRITIPQAVGHEMSGIISEVGSSVNDWHVGDRVVVCPLDSCGSCPACLAGYAHVCHKLKFLGIDTPGAFQEYWKVPAKTLYHIDDKLTLKEAALIEPIAVACHDVRLGEIKAGDYTVVIGGGPIGILIALVALHFGARVLMSEINPFRLSFIRSLGIEAINPMETDIITHVKLATLGAGADAVFEVSGSNAGAVAMTEIVGTRGRIIIVAMFAQVPQVDLFKFFWKEIRLCGVRVYEPEDFRQAIELVADKTLPLEQLISNCYPLEKLQLAFQRLESGDNIIKLLIDIEK